MNNTPSLRGQISPLVPFLAPPREPSRGALPRSLLEEPSQRAFSRSLPKEPSRGAFPRSLLEEPSRGAFPRSLSRRPVNIWPDDGVFKKKKYRLVFSVFRHQWASYSRCEALVK